jgi:hypothetical protein
MDESKYVIIFKETRSEKASENDRLSNSLGG